ncbi:MAG: type III secretion system export apparatus subunit SctT [Candidatus Symbiodolus clandestinus]
MESWITYLPSLALSLFRPLGVITFLPLLSARSLGGALIRNALVLTIILPLIPLNVEQAPVGLENLNLLLQCYGKELFIGLLIGFATAVPFWALDVASFIIDTMRGASMGTLLNPLLGEQSSIYGMLFSQLYATLFLGFGGFHQLLTTLYASYQLLVPGQTITLDHTLFLFLKQLWLLMFQLGMGFALPSMLIMLLIDIAMGLLNRSAQQLNVFFLAMPIKSALVLLLLVVSLGSALQLYRQHTFAIPEQLLQLLSQLGSRRE